MRYRLLRRLKCALVDHAWDDSPAMAEMPYRVCARCRNAYPKTGADLATVAHAQSFMDGYARGYGAMISGAQERANWRGDDL